MEIFYIFTFENENYLYEFERFDTLEQLQTFKEQLEEEGRIRNILFLAVVEDGSIHYLNHEDLSKMVH